MSKALKTAYLAVMGALRTYFGYDDQKPTGMGGAVG